MPPFERPKHESAESGTDRSVAAAGDGSSASNDMRQVAEHYSSLIVAHRGGAANRVENTLGAFQEGIDQGADGIETDIRLTKDGQLVCMHDYTTRRLTGKFGLVENMSLNQLRENNFEANGEQAEIQAVDEVIPWLLDQKDPPQFFPETKHPVRYGQLVEYKLFSTLRKWGLTEPGKGNNRSHLGEQESLIIPISFSQRAIRCLNRLAPRLPAIQLSLSTRLLGNQMAGDTSRSFGVPAASLRNNPGFAARAVQAGQDFWCWTRHDPDDVWQAQELGAKWISTNHPRQAREVLRNAR